MRNVEKGWCIYALKRNEQFLKTEQIPLLMSEKQDQDQVEELLKKFGVFLQQEKDQTNQLIEPEKLKDIFEKLTKENDFIKREVLLIQDAKRFEIPLEEYRRLYALYTKKSNPITKFWHLSKLDKAYKWFGGEKKPWDFVQLLATISIPVLIAYGTTTFTDTRAKQETLTKYYDYINSLITAEENKPIVQVKNSPKTNESTSKIWIVARARTLAAFRDLKGDEERKVQLLFFLKEAKLIENKLPKIPLADADLTYLNLSNRNLSDINLSDANLKGTNMEGSKLSGVDLSGAKMLEITLNQKTDLRGSDLKLAETKTSALMVALLCQTGMPEINREGEQVMNNRDCRLPDDIYGPSLYVVDTPGSVGLNIYSGPGINYPVVGAVSNGTVLSTIGGAVYSDGYAWEQLTDGNWIQGDYVK